jgi:hypothetical protein
MKDLGASWHSLAGAVRCEHCRHALHSTEDCAHPSFPLGARVRDRMNGGIGTVTLSRYNRVMVQWESPARYVGDFDGWQAGNNLRRAGVLAS